MSAYVSVIGPGEATDEEETAAEQVGRLLAEHDATIVCGGLGGVMAAVCRGAGEAGGTSIGLLPGRDRGSANAHVTVAIPTGLGELRNGLVIRAADAVIAIGGGYGTLSEISLALRTGVPVVGIGTWQIDGVEQLAAPREAVARALRLARCRGSSPPT